MKRHLDHSLHLLKLVNPHIDIIRPGDVECQYGDSDYEWFEHEICVVTYQKGSVVVNIVGFRLSSSLILIVSCQLISNHLGLLQHRFGC